jgi:hypothetical protein
MKTIIKIEEFALFALFTSAYFYLYPGLWIFFVAMFFVPDSSFACYLISSKAGAIGYNLLHHKGVMAIMVLFGLYIHNDLLIKIGLVFLAHSAFDRTFGYGLKFYDHFSHTHLGWIGKHKVNPPTL